MSLNVLVLGSGAREHAIAKAISESKILKKLYLACANDGFKDLGENIEFESYGELALKGIEKQIDLLVVGPEGPLCEGIVDIFDKFGIKSIGVNQYFSKLESSKLFAKSFMQKYDIETSEVLTRLCAPPYVVKEDGLAYGKGVLVTNNYNLAQERIEELKNQGKAYFVDEYLEGEEYSLMSLYDGKTLLNFKMARDFKRLNANPESPNTGGMGAFCPVILNEYQEIALYKYTKKLERALREEGAEFCGFIYSGLVYNEGKFKVLEYNVRLGDPEAQAILGNLKSDFLEILYMASQRRLDEVELEYKEGVCAALTIAAYGYPTNPILGEKIENLPESLDVYFAGVKKRENFFYTSGGRVLSLVKNSPHPFKELYEAAHKVQFKNKYFRDDLCV